MCEDSQADWGSVASHSAEKIAWKQGANMSILHDLTNLQAKWGSLCHDFLTYSTIDPRRPGKCHDFLT